MSEAETGMSEMPPLRDVEDDGESEDVIDGPEDGDVPPDETDTEDDEDGS